MHHYPHLTACVNPSPTSLDTPLETDSDLEAEWLAQESEMGIVALTSWVLEDAEAGEQLWAPVTC